MKLILNLVIFLFLVGGTFIYLTGHLLPSGLGLFIGMIALLASLVPWKEPGSKSTSYDYWSSKYETKYGQFYQFTLQSWLTVLLLSALIHPKSPILLKPYPLLAGILFVTGILMFGLWLLAKVQYRKLK